MTADDLAQMVQFVRGGRRTLDSQQAQFIVDLIEKSRDAAERPTPTWTRESVEAMLDAADVARRWKRPLICECVLCMTHVNIADAKRDEILDALFPSPASRSREER